MSKDEFELYFPKLKTDSYEITSDPTSEYNCIAWAVRDKMQWWTPDADGRIRGYYWPPGVLKEFTVAALVQIFEIHGFRKCDSAEFEPGVEKVAIYGKSNGEGTHAARQKQDGTWTSKLGAEDDIRHELSSLEGDFDSVSNPDDYGTVVQIMKKALPPGWKD